MSDEELVKRLRRADEYEPLGHDGWEAADRIEALTEQLEAARADAKEAEAYAEELEKELVEWSADSAAGWDKCEEHRIKLAKAVQHE